MDLICNDIYQSIINYLGLILLPDKFYQLRIICKRFKDCIDNFKKGFCFSLYNELGITTNTYSDWIDKNYLLLNNPVNFKNGLNILYLDNWHLTKKTIPIYPYPKWEKNESRWVFILNKMHWNKKKQKWINSSKKKLKVNNLQDHMIEWYIIEYYKNKYEYYLDKFYLINHKKTLKWIKQNEENINMCPGSGHI